MSTKENIITVRDYEQYIGKDAVDRIRTKAEALKDLHVTNVNSTYYGGGVSVLLSSLTLLMNDLGIKTGWRLIQGSPDFFGITKKMHNALQGGEFNLSKRKKDIYESVIYENVIRNHLDHDFVIVHDPQPLFLIKHYRKKGPWIWRCHVDLSDPHPGLWQYLKPMIEKYDAVLVSSKDYIQDLDTPQRVLMPAIDPFSIANRELSDSECHNRLKRYKIPTDLPLIVQISRFDRWKDPQGVIDAFRIVRKSIPSTLVLLGNVATDDPEGTEVYKSLLNQREERILILSQEDTALVNALQRKAAVVVQKSLREGFGLTVTEAMWKGKPVVAGNVGGIRLQIDDGKNGYLVSDIEETAERILTILSEPKLGEKIGRNARESVKHQFLLTRYLEQYLDLMNGFESNYRLKGETG